MIFTTSKIIKRFKVSPKQLLLWSNQHKLNIWVSSLMWIPPPPQESIWLKDDKKKNSKMEARDTNAYLASASCPMLCRWNLSPLVSFLQSGKCPQNESLSWKVHSYTASQTFLLQRKQVQKTDREVVQQRSRAACYICNCHWVSLCSSPEASYYCELLTITRDNGLWWVMTDVRPPQRSII